MPIAIEEEEPQARVRAAAAEPSIPHDRSAELRLRRWFPPRRAAYAARVLTPGELAVIADPADALILARIKRMPEPRLRRFDRLVPADPHHHQLFRVLQLNWLKEEEYLLSTRLGRWPTPKELSLDYMGHRNGLRFRAYFAMKYPDGMRPAGRLGDPPRG